MARVAQKLSQEYVDRRGGRVSAWDEGMERPGLPSTPVPKGRARMVILPGKPKTHRSVVSNTRTQQSAPRKKAVPRL